MRTADKIRAVGRRFKAAGSPNVGRAGWTSITDVVLGRRPAALLAAVLLLAVGLVAAGRLQRELFPDVELPVATIITVYAGSDPQSVADQITKPIEDAVAGTKGLKTLSSTSEAGVSVVIAQFAFGTDMTVTTNAMQQAVNRVALPESAQRPQVQMISVREMPVLRLSLVAGGDADAAALRRLAEQQIVPKLASAEGVRSVAVVGGANRRLLVSLRAADLAEKGISPGQVAAALRAGNVTIPAGDITESGRDLPVRVHNKLDSPEAIAELPLPTGPAAALAAASGAGPGSLPDGAGQPPQVAGQLPQAAGTPGAPSPQAASQTYEVRAGDTLSGIARRLLGDEGAWRRIAAANPSLTNPDLINPGTRLVIPPGSPTGDAAVRNAAAVLAQPATEPSQLAPSGSAPILKIGDVADVHWYVPPDASISRTNGKPSVGLAVSADPDADVVATAAAVERALHDLRGTLQDADADVLTISNQATYIQQQLDDLARDALFGGLLAVLIIALFLRSLRSTAVIAVSIPTSLLLALALISSRDMTLNLMTLGGLAVSTGRIVDDAIVVLEAVYRHRQQGASALVAARNGTREVGGAVVASTLTTVVVFLPLTLVGGVVGEFFRPFALTATLALLASLVIALTLIPVLGSFLLLPGKGEARDTALQRVYTPLIRSALRHRLVVVAAAGLVSLASIWAMAGVDRTFLPTSAEKILQVKVEMPSGTSPETTAEASVPVEDILKRTPDVDVYQLSVGNTRSLVGASSFSPGKGQTGEFYVRLRADADVDAVTERFRGELARLKSPASISVAPSSGSSGPPGGNLEIVLTGPNRDELAQSADEMARALQNVPGLADVRSDAAQANPEVSVKVDPGKAAAKGLTPAQVALSLRDTIAGQRATTLSVDGEEVDVDVAVNPADLDSAEKVANLPLGGPGSVRLSDVADVQVVNGPTQIVRRDREQAQTVTGAITSQNTSTVNLEVQEIVDQLRLPDGVEVTMGGVFADMNEGFASLGLALLAAVGLVYLVMVATMGSVAVPLVVMVSLPLAAIGALGALYITGTPLGMSALIGLLMLIGIVVTNAIVLLDRVSQLRAAGSSVSEALVGAGRTRVRPIVITALTTILGLSPLAAGLSEGTLFAREMAIVVMGGLLTSTLLTLVVVPVVYSLALGRREQRPAPDRNR